MTTTTHPPHPSFLELDRLALSTPPGELERRLDHCPRCLAQVARLRQPVATPAWVTELSAGPAKPWWGLIPPWVSVWLLGCAAAVVLLFKATSGIPGTSGDAVRPKGLPGVSVFVRQGAEVRKWDGHGAIHPGDSLRLEVQPQEFGYVTVATPAGASGAPLVLYEGPLPPGRATLLPQGLRVDAEGRAEELRVVFSQGPLTPEQLSGAVVLNPAFGWMVDLTVPKEKP